MKSFLVKTKAILLKIKPYLKKLLLLLTVVMALIVPYCREPTARAEEENYLTIGRPEIIFSSSLYFSGPSFTMPLELRLEPNGTVHLLVQGYGNVVINDGINNIDLAVNNFGLTPTTYHFDTIDGNVAGIKDFYAFQDLTDIELQFGQYITSQNSQTQSIVDIFYTTQQVPNFELWVRFIFPYVNVNSINPVNLKPHLLFRYDYGVYSNILATSSNVTLNPMQSLISSVDGFLSIELLPNVRISYILTLVIGLSLARILLRMV